MDNRQPMVARQFEHAPDRKSPKGVVAHRGVLKVSKTCERGRCRFCVTASCNHECHRSGR